MQSSQAPAVANHPSASAPAGATAQAGSAAAGAAGPAFLSELCAAIDRGKEYPVVSRARHQTGTVDVGFVLKKSGLIEAVHVVRPSGFASLDQAGLNTVLRLGRFKPVPDELSPGDWSLTVPISFVLN
jgi:protein TonB